MLAEQQLLAHCYAAEALCNLESPQQAAEQLQAAVALQDYFGISSMQEAARAGGDVGTDSHVSAIALALCLPGPGSFSVVQLWYPFYPIYPSILSAKPAVSYQGVCITDDRRAFDIIFYVIKIQWVLLDVPHTFQQQMSKLMMRDVITEIRVLHVVGVRLCLSRCRFLSGQ